MPQSMAHSQAGPVECWCVGGGYGTDRQIGLLLNGRKSTVLLFDPQAELAMGQALFVNSFPLSLAVRLNSLLLPTEPGAGWKFLASGSAGQPRRREYRALHKSSHPIDDTLPRPSRHCSQWLRTCFCDQSLYRRVIGFCRLLLGSGFRVTARALGTMLRSMKSLISHELLSRANRVIE